MSTVIFPSLTNQVVLTVFEFLVNAELKKRQTTFHDLKWGCQEGMIASLAILFGSANDEEYQEAYGNGNTWLEVTEAIVDRELRDWCDVIDDSEDATEISAEALKKDVKMAVENYALAHPEKLINALKTL